MLKAEKPKEVEKLKELINNHSTIGVLNMQKLPARQLLKIRNNLRGTAIIRMSRKNLLIRSLRECGKNDLADVIENLERFSSPALILSNLDAFRLYQVIKRNRTSIPAKLGDILRKDVTIKKGSTNLPPGPAISTLQKIGLKTRIEGGKIAIVDDKTLKSGTVVNEDLVNVFNLLKIEPMEIGLDLVAAWDGNLYKKDILDVDVDDYIKEIQLAIENAINLSMNVGYPTKLTIERMLQKAFIEAKELCLMANIFELAIDEILADAISKAEILEKKIQF